MDRYIIMGVQGSGKGTQAKLLAEHFDFVHICVGDVFRWHIQNHTKTQPILELFQGKELVVAVDGTKPAAEVQNELHRKLGLDARRCLARPPGT